MTLTGRRMPVNEDQKFVKAVVEAWNTPIVFHPGGWEDTLPEWLRGRVISERVEMLDNGGWDKGTDAEVSCYLYTANLNRPLGWEWTHITLFEAAKQIPQIRQVLDAVPEKLTRDEERQLDDLKHKIRNSQLRHPNNNKKETDMSKRKVVLDERDDGVLIGVMQEKCDPVTMTCETTLEAALLEVPRLLETAEAKWKTSPRNPTYQAPEKPKTTPPPAKRTTTPAATVPGGKAEELPLLKGKGATKAAEKPVAAPADGSAPETPAATSPASTGETTAPPAETKPAVDETKAPAGETPPAGAVAGAPAPAATTPAAAPTAPGEWQYYLEDGRGPYADVQKAMDDLGIDKTERPHHNRWDRLSTEFKKKIQRRAKS